MTVAKTTNAVPQVEFWKIDRFIEYARNPRKNDHVVNRIASAINEFGFKVPIIAKSDGSVVDGHLRLKAARKLKLEALPVLLADDLTDAQIKAFRLSINKMAEIAEWDDELLALELEELKELDFDLDLIGFDEDELGSLLQVDTEGLTDDDAVPEVPDEPISRRGDIWLLGNHRVMCGSATDIEDVERLTAGEGVDLVFADPPYGIDVVQSNQVGGAAPTKFGTADGSNIVDASTYSKIIGDETTDTAKGFYDLCVNMEFKNIVLWGGNYFTSFLYPSRCWIIWDKEMTGNFSEAEMAWTSFSKGGVKVFKFLWNGLSREGSRKEELKSRVHPTQKPVGLFSDIFNRFDGFKTIFDGFGGSGSTLIACEKTNRNCRMMELDEKYCDVIVQRWQDFTGKQATLESTGETFNKQQEAA